MTEEKTPRKHIWADPYRDNAYVNRYSRKAWPALLSGVLAFVLLVAFAIWRWKEMDQWEQTGGNISMQALEWLLYKASGKWGEAVVFCLLGIICLVSGFSKWQKQKRLLESSDHSK